MLSKIWREWRFPVEFALLLALVFFLPLREAPKNILWLAYVIVWVVNRARGGGWGGRWSGWDTLISVWLASGYLAALFAGIPTPEANEWGAVNDLARYLSLLFCLRRAGYSHDQKIMLLSMLVASCLLASTEAWWRWKIAHARKAFELASVGHVNHSAIYMVICAGALFSLVLEKWLAWQARSRIVAAAALMLMLSWIFMTDSRSAVLAALMLMVALMVAGVRTGKAGVKTWPAMVLVLAVAIGVGGWGAVTRQIVHTETNNMLAERDMIWRGALVASRTHPLFGVGMDNYSRITEARLREWLAARGAVFVKSDYRLAPHAHSLYLNTLTERGLAGLGVLLVVLAAWGMALWRRWPLAPARGTKVSIAGSAERSGTRRSAVALVEEPETGKMYTAGAPLNQVSMAVWGASFSGWFTTIVIGFANTTLHHEHALLAVITLGLLLAEEPP